MDLEKMRGLVKEAVRNAVENNIVVEEENLDLEDDDEEEDDLEDDDDEEEEDDSLEETVVADLGTSDLAVSTGITKRRDK